jgi:hypothetical protein
MTFARDKLLQSADDVNALKRKTLLRAAVPMSSRETDRGIGEQGSFSQ